MLFAGRNNAPEDDIDVVIPTFQRPQQLARCLAGLEEQRLRPARVIVVVRTDDDATKRWLEAAHRDVVITYVNTPGVIAAMTEGVRVSSAAVVAFTDDDAVPRADWTTRLMAHFRDEEVGAVGGRDVIGGIGQPNSAVSVGRFTPYGRRVGNHHVGIGAPRDVHVLKGVNMAFRSEALALPRHGVLRGEGAQVDFELLSCGWARRQGWRILYDPAVAVDHFPAARQGQAQRGSKEHDVVFDSAYNAGVGSVAFSGSAALIRGGYGLLVGTQDRPGAGRLGWMLVRGRPGEVRRGWNALRGRWRGVIRAAFQACVDPGKIVVTAAEVRGQLQKSMPAEVEK
jgi:hypothetical protein